jgi:putative chitinase
VAYFASNVEHECGGFTIRNLTENINYTAARMAAVWPKRFASAAVVRARFGTADGWQLRAFDEIYGGRMGNRPGTHDGSLFIGRGGPQITGRDGYAAVGRLAGLDLVAHPELACLPEHQPAICAAFWTWKGLNRFADAGDFLGCVKVWNGGTNGLADRRAMMAGNDPVINRLRVAADVTDVVNAIAAPSIVPAQSPIVEDTAWLQRSLNRLGAKPALDPDGSYGSLTKSAVKEFQRLRGLSVDGIAGPKTLAAVSAALLKAPA